MGNLQTFVVYTVISFIFILIRIFGTLQNPLATGIGVVILCQIAVHLIMKKLKKSSYVQIVHEEYLKMNVEERKKHYKRGLLESNTYILLSYYNYCVLKADNCNLLS